MNLNILFYLCVVLLLKLAGIYGIRTTLQAIPSIVRRGGHTVLKCSYYDLQGAPLYVVKWYRGMREFYRFDPNDTPQKRVFEIPGIYVDLSYSNSTQVTLRKLEFSSSGNYTCEVSADGPPFPTASYTAHVEVIAPPTDGPTITTTKTYYAPGDELLVNCSGPPSRPALNLTLLINNQHMSGAKKLFYEVEGGFTRSELVVTETLSNYHFRGGRLVIRCVAQLRPVYVETAIKTFWLSTDPKPERITSGDTGGTSITTSNIFLILSIICLFLLKSVHPQDYGDFYNALDDIAFQDTYYEELSPDIQASLINP